MSDPFIARLENNQLHLLEIVQAYSDFNLQIRTIENIDFPTKHDIITEEKLKRRCEAIFSYIKKHLNLYEKTNRYNQLT